MSEDHENRPVLRLLLLDPWQERPGIWSADTPEWRRTLGTVDHAGWVVTLDSRGRSSTAGHSRKRWPGV